ncbi:protein DDI1 homolog 2 isoform X1 [Hoplias malabaricus]|uniref:protein DDI1 homolog 2 isoform X1 n=1 Tax=Hoplias malabaricus TaxID=27720 RepID=UPI003462ED86
MSPPLSLCKPFDIPTSSSPSTSSTRSITLDRSKSAPASTHQSLPPEILLSSSQTQEETKSHLSDNPSMTEYSPSYGQEELLSSPPQSLAESSQNPVHGLVDAFKPHSQPVTNSTMPNTEATETLLPPVLPAQESFSSTVSMDHEVTSLVTCEESMNNLDVDVVEDITLQEVKETLSPFTNLNTTQLTEALLHEVDMADPTDAKTIGLDIPDQLQENVQDSTFKTVHNQGDLTPASELTLHNSLARPNSSSETPVVHSEIEKNTDARSASKSAVPSDKDNTEGDNIPSLAQALKELHELLMSNTHAQACERSSQSASLTTTSSQDAEKVDQDSIADDIVSLNSTVGSSSSHTAITTETTIAKSEHTAQSEDGIFNVTPLSSEGQEDDEVANIKTKQDTTPSLYTPERDQMSGNGGENVSEPRNTSPLQNFCKFKEGPESQERGGDGEWGTLAFESPEFTEASQQKPLSVAAGSSVDNSSFVAPSHPSTPTVTGQYPAEHIQRIQAAGFSSHEAAEALERAEGSVDLALLVLLARKITVPS